MSEKSTGKLTKEQKEEATRRVLAGESASSLGREFGVTRAYIALLKAHALYPERYLQKAESKMSRKLTRSEKDEFVRIVSTSTPEDQDLIPAREKWTLEHGEQLIWRLFKKKASVRFLKDTMEPYIPKRSEFRFTKPQPPKKHHINQIDPEMAKDPDYVAYYLSPICEQIAWREYELALADWEERFAHEDEERERSEEQLKEPPQRGPVLMPGLRVGKHAKSKGSPFTPSKRKKKRR
jgi:hypothetical protein